MVLELEAHEGAISLYYEAEPIVLYFTNSVFSETFNTFAKKAPDQTFSFHTSIFWSAHIWAHLMS